MARIITGKQGLLRSLRLGAVSGLNGKVVSDTKVTIFGNPGRIIRIAVPNRGMTATIKTFIDGNRVYQITVIHRADRGSMVAAANFLNSFKMTTRVVGLTRG